MFKMMLIAMRSDNARKAAAAQPQRRVRAAQAGDFSPIEVPHV
ncbi:MAG: hypothetical protein U1F07_13350 [Rubrivivax sp.]